MELLLRRSRCCDGAAQHQLRRSHSGVASLGRGAQIDEATFIVPCVDSNLQGRGPQS